MGTLQPNELATLINEVQSAARQDAWNTIRSLLGKEVLRRIHEGTERVSDDELEPDASLAEKIERTFWRDVWQRRRDLPADSAEFGQELVKAATRMAADVAEQYQAFRRLLSRCKPGIRQYLLNLLGKEATDRAKALARQVDKRLWDLRQRLPEDCPLLNTHIHNVCDELYHHSELFRRAVAGDTTAREEVFTAFRDHMLQACRRAYPEIPEHDREDILHDAVIEVLEGISSALDPEHISTWRAFLRTIVVRAGRKWTAERRRFVRASELGAGDRG